MNRVLITNKAIKKIVSTAEIGGELAVPANLTLSNTGKTIILTWDKVSYASGYTAQYQVNGTDENSWSTLTEAVFTEEGNSVSTSFTGVVNTKYYFRVQSNGSGIYSDSAFCEPKNTRAGIRLSSLTLSTSAPVVGDVITFTLTTSTGVIPSAGDVTYQWYTVNSSNQRTAITGETGTSFTVTEAQVGYSISCIATAREGSDYYGNPRVTTMEVVPPIG